MAPTNSHSFVLDISERFIVRFKFVPDESVSTGAQDSAGTENAVILAPGTSR